MNAKDREDIRKAHTLAALERHGFTGPEFCQLRRISNTLQRWHERECNEDIRRHEEGPRKGKLYGVRHVKGWDDKWIERRYPVRDMEAGAMARLNRIMADHLAFVAYVQTDPRGAALYLVEKSKLKDGVSLDSVYSSIGICIY